MTDAGHGPEPVPQRPEEVHRYDAEGRIVVLPQHPVASMRINVDVVGLSRVLREADQHTAECAAEFLADIGTPECARALLAGLGDPSAGPLLRRAIIRGLGQVRDRRAVPALIEILQAPGESWEAPREEAIWALGRIGDPRAVQALLDAPTLFLGEVLKALVRIGGSEVTTGILARLWGWLPKNDTSEDAGAALAAVFALRRLRSPLSVPALVQLAGTVGFPLILRRAAAESLRDFDLGEADEAGRVSWIKVALADPDPWLSVAAADAMARTPWGMHDLRWHARDKEVHVRQAICVAFGNHGDDSDVSVLSDLLAKDSDIAVRQAAAAALARLGGRNASRALIDALADRRTCESAARAIAALPAAPSAELRRTAEHRTGHQRRGAVMALGLLGDHNAAPLLLSMLDSSEEPLQTAAVDALGLLRHQPASRKLVEILNDQQAGGRLRARVAWALGRLSRAGGTDPTGAVSLTTALNDPIDSVRLRATEALAALPVDLRTTQVAQALARVANQDPSTDIRLAAVEALSALGPTGRSKLRYLTESATTPVRAAAVAAYASDITGADLSLLEQITADDDDAAAIAAVEALGKLGDSRAVPVLGACTETPTDTRPRPKVQSAAVDALVAIGDETAKQAITRLYQNAELYRGLTRAAVNAIAVQQHDESGA